MNSAIPQTLTMIMAGGRGERLYPLTRDVAKPAVIFAGCYKIIDFALSNCFNSGLRRIYLLTQYSNATMSRHLKLAWDSLFRSELDEFLESLPPQHSSAEDWYHGTADSIYQNISVLQRHRPEYLLLLSGDHVYKMNYLEMLGYHARVGADLTIAAVETERVRAHEFGVIEADSDSRVNRFIEKPKNPPALAGDPEKSLVSMGIYVFSTATLVRELIRDAKDSDSSHDFGKDIIPSLIRRGNRVFVHPFRDKNTGASGYWRDIGTLNGYFTCNLDLISSQPEMDLYEQQWPVHTCVKPYPPACIVEDATEVSGRGEVVNSLIGPGCVISGARVERSVLSPRVQVRAGAYVSECILMDGVEVGYNSILRRTIVCPGVIIPNGTKIGVDPIADRSRFVVTEQNVTVIPADYTW